MLRRTAAAGALTLGLAACSVGGGTGGHSSARPGTPRQSASASAAACPATYAAPDPERPRVRLEFRLDGGTVVGVESVAFTPDLPIRTLVFRLWPENPVSRSAGSRLAVTSATVEGRSTVPETSPTDPTLLTLRLPAPVAARHAVHARLEFRLTLPPAGRDRYGVAGDTAWWGTGAPLLAWERGVGWATEQAASVLGESQTSEAAVTDVVVDVPAGETVLMTGRQSPPTPSGAGRALWRSHAETARDVSVAVARFAVRRAALPGGAPLTVGVAPGVAVDPARLSAVTIAAVRTHAERFGPFPYESLAVTALPGLTRTGVEYPGAIQIGDDPYAATLVHEVAHQWFYGLVGDDQARDPWLDEGFATYAQALTSPSARASAAQALDEDPQSIGWPARHWSAGDRTYYWTVYLKAAGALLAARSAVGAARFDAAVRCFVTANAWRIARPADLVRALVGLPAAVAELRRAGALP